MPQPRPASLRRVLIVDDSEVIRAVLCELLRVWGYEPVTATNAAQALTIAGREAVDAVFTDLELGGTTGLELCRELRQFAHQHGRELPVWLMSGSDLRDYTVEATAAGAKGFFRKPFNPGEVERRLAAAFPRRPGEPGG